MAGGKNEITNRKHLNFTQFFVFFLKDTPASPQTFDCFDPPGSDCKSPPTPWTRYGTQPKNIMSYSRFNQQGERIQCGTVNTPNSLLSLILSHKSYQNFRSSLHNRATGWGAFSTLLPSTSGCAPEATALPLMQPTGTQSRSFTNEKMSLKNVWNKPYSIHLFSMLKKKRKKMRILILSLSLFFIASEASFFAERNPSINVFFPKKVLQGVDQTAEIRLSSKINGLNHLLCFHLFSKLKMKHFESFSCWIASFPRRRKRIF